MTVAELKQLAEERIAERPHVLLAVDPRKVAALCDVAEAAGTYRDAVREGPEADQGIALSVTFRSLARALAALDEAMRDA